MTHSEDTMTHFIDGWEEIEATCVGEVTLVGYIEHEYPMAHGNCFGLLCASLPSVDGRHYRILNFNHENLEELLRRETIAWPLKIRVDPKRDVAFLNDPRIPDDWYDACTCSVCAPSDLIDTHTRLAQLRRIATGDRVEHPPGPDGIGRITEKVKAESRMLDTKWSVEAEPDLKPGHFMAPYVVEQGDGIVNGPDGVIDIPESGDVLKELGGEE